MNLGRSFLDAGYYDDAVEVFRTAGATSGKYGDRKGFARAAAWAGLAHMISRLKVRVLRGPSHRQAERGKRKAPLSAFGGWRFVSMGQHVRGAQLQAVVPLRRHWSRNLALRF
jgi:hypothetical protein